MVLNLKLFYQHVNVVLKIFKHFPDLNNAFTRIPLSLCVKSLLDEVLRPADLLLSSDYLFIRDHMRD